MILLTIIIIRLNRKKTGVSGTRSKGIIRRKTDPIINCTKKYMERRNITKIAGEKLFKAQWRRETSFEELSNCGSELL